MLQKIAGDMLGDKEKWAYTRGRSIPLDPAEYI
jgi:hypothetical protein